VLQEEVVRGGKRGDGGCSTPFEAGVAARAVGGWGSGLGVLRGGRGERGAGGLVGDQTRPRRRRAWTGGTGGMGAGEERALTSGVPKHSAGQFE
jgi:hypothetical protein